MTEKIIVTSALPYANGPIHLGHLVEYIQTDIWVRFQKLRGHRCLFVCADDTHGTAIMLRAAKEERREIELIAEMQQQHERDFAGFGIEFDHYGSTNSDENYELCKQFWAALRAAEMKCDALFKGTSVDGVYDSDPKVNSQAKRFDSVTYDRVLADNLKVMDASAVALCRDNEIPIVVFSIREKGNLARVLAGEGVQTIVRKEA